MTIGERRTDARRLMRRVASLRAKVSGSQVRARPVTIVDVTSLGCCLDGAFRSSPGERILLTIDPIGPLAVTVVWCSGQRLGVEFVQALHPAVLDHVRRINVGRVEGGPALAAP